MPRWKLSGRERGRGPRITRPRVPKRGTSHDLDRIAMLQDRMSTLGLAPRESGKGADHHARDIRRPCPCCERPRRRDSAPGSRVCGFPRPRHIRAGRPGNPPGQPCSSTRKHFSQCENVLATFEIIFPIDSVELVALCYLIFLGGGQVCYGDEAAARCLVYGPKRRESSAANHMARGYDGRGMMISRSTALHLSS